MAVTQFGAPIPGNSLFTHAPGERPWERPAALNTVEEAGTEFKFQNFKATAKKGKTLIWPTDFTHTHRGVISLSKEKYIITGWLSFIE